MRAQVCGAGRMRAWRLHAYGAPAELRLDEARVPPLRAPDHVLVRVAAASLNPLDVAMIGGYGARALNALRALDGGEGVEFPLVAGRDFAGTVVRAGPAARLRAGQRVWGVVPPHRQGSHAEFVIVKDEWAGPAPSTLDTAAAGGALYAALTACALLRVAGLRGAEAAGARVLLLGLGGVGQAALQLLAAAGAQVTVGCTGELGARAVLLGASEVLDRHAENYGRLLEEGGPYDAILDCAGLGGDEAGARRWRFARYVTLSSPLLRLTDARGLAAGALCAAAALLRQAAAARAAHVRWAYFAPSAADIEALRKLAERGRVSRALEFGAATTLGRAVPAENRGIDPIFRLNPIDPATSRRKFDVDTIRNESVARWSRAAGASVTLVRRVCSSAWRWSACSRGGAARRRTRAPRGAPRAASSCWTSARSRPPHPGPPERNVRCFRRDRLFSDYKIYNKR